MTNTGKKFVSGQPITNRSRTFFRWGAFGALLMSLVVIALAFWLEPDPRGRGTHQQLGLPACGFLETTGFPGPSCGLTTSFAHEARGEFVKGFHVQPLGAILFWGSVGGAVCSVLILFGEGSGLDRLARWLNGRWLFLLLVIWMLSWIYKLQRFAQFPGGG